MVLLNHAGTPETEFGQLGQNKNMNLDLIISIVTALGIFEVIKRTLLYFWDNNILRHNQERREIADLALRAMAKLMRGQFMIPLPEDITLKLYEGVHIIDGEDKKMASNFMQMINAPVIIQTLLESQKKSGYSDLHSKEIHDWQMRMYDMEQELMPILRKMRYESPISIKFPFKISTLRNWLSARFHSFSPATGAIKI